MTDLLKEQAMILRAAIQDWHRTLRLVTILLASTALVAVVTVLR
jgi:hypothetical protein